MTGKDKCAILKSIRIRLAELNGITYIPHTCNNKKDCIGTCHICDKESIWLLHKMKAMEKDGYPIIYSINNSSIFDISNLCSTDNNYV